MVARKAREDAMRVAATLAVLILMCGAAAAQDVLTYHADAARSGRYVVPGLTWAAAAKLHRDTAFNGRLSGDVYAQPLYWQAPGAAHGMLVVATENNVVEALDAQTGVRLWRHVLGNVVPLSSLPCGNISPVGVTGTPAIDGKTGAVYLDAFVTRHSGTAEHLVFGLSLQDGSVLPGWPVSVADGIARLGQSFTPTWQNQRGGLLLKHGKLFVPFGGNAGDCESYHGWVVGLDVAQPSVFGAWATRAEKGGIWSQGALADDGTSLFTATGNTSGASTWGDGEGIFRLPADLSHSTATTDYYAAANWQQLDQEDADLGGTGPLPINLPLGSGQTQQFILGLGKDGNAYVLDRANLGGIGGALRGQQVASSAIITAGAVAEARDRVTVAFRATGSACPGGLSDSSVVALAIAPGSGAAPLVATAWCAAFSGASVPIVTVSAPHTDPIVWMVGGSGDQRLHGFRADTGAVVFAGGGTHDAASGTTHLTAPVAAEGRLYVAGDGRVYSYVFTP
jgi:hypothetical protein